MGELSPTPTIEDNMINEKINVHCGCGETWQINNGAKTNLYHCGALYVSFDEDVTLVCECEEVINVKKGEKGPPRHKCRSYIYTITAVNSPAKKEKENDSGSDKADDPGKDNKKDSGEGDKKDTTEAKRKTLREMKVAELRVIAKTIPGLKGVATMKRKNLVKAIKKFFPEFNQKRGPQKGTKYNKNKTPVEPKPIDLKTD